MSPCSVPQALITTLARAQEVLRAEEICGYLVGGLLRDQLLQRQPV